MVTATANKQLAETLRAMLADTFPGLTVDVAHSKRWGRPCVTFRWVGFAGLLVEERFHRLTQAIPEDFRVSNLGGFVWLELTPDESIDEVLKQPRSEDMAPREAAIYAELRRASYFEALAKALGRAPKKTCPGDFSETQRWSDTVGWTPDQVRDAKLMFIRHGVYCDCQVVLTLQPQLAEAYPSI